MKPTVDSSCCKINQVDFEHSIALSRFFWVLLFVFYKHEFPDVHLNYAGFLLRQDAAMVF